MEDTGEDNYLQQYVESPVSIHELDPMENLEYAPNGESFAYTTDSSLKIFSASKLSLKNIITAKIDQMKFFQNNTILFSRGGTIFHLSVHDNKLFRRFEAEGDSVCSISVNSGKDTFMTVGKESVELWDYRYQDPAYSVKFSGRLGAIGGNNEYVLSDGNFVYLFDWRNSKGPLSVKSIKPNFYKQIWYTGDCSYITLSTFKSHLLLDAKGDQLSAFSLDNVCAPDVVNESNILLCGSGNRIFSYRISEKESIGRISVPNFECAVIRANPAIPQFICASETQIKMWSIPFTTDTSRY